MRADGPGTVFGAGCSALIELLALGSLFAAAGADRWRPTARQAMGYAQPLEIGFVGTAWSIDPKDWQSPEHQAALFQIAAALKGRFPVHILSRNLSAIDEARAYPSYQKRDRGSRQVHEFVVIRGPAADPYRRPEWVSTHVRAARSTLFDPKVTGSYPSWLPRDLQGQIDARFDSSAVIGPWIRKYAPFAEDLLNHRGALVGTTLEYLPYGEKSGPVLRFKCKTEPVLSAFHDIDKLMADARSRAGRFDNLIRRKLKDLQRKHTPAVYEEMTGRSAQTGRPK